jgi:DNA-directed RNA polymerase subunit N (RpoN/RPB10)
MYPYIRCFCGRPLGQLWVLFNELKRKKIEFTFGDLGADPDYLQSAIIPVETGDILDSLHLHAHCCRARIVTQVRFVDVY